ncbi:thioredoxin domain-containing protein [Enterobacteriaceae endosymbiont of Neohaemonia nigricornis]|uniref:thioredoxin domain-containing protein n=1 Tax=Enterobacteriaceae endosymbiont of Neohaemonia nigricornis TaxID=2675792 RepID=UPI001449A2DB|nr:thioredoxin domain-containing protein [Enterobacteriaceae endosymbiont of Neohaemonia nigricornis]QJC30563.1 thioredoxin domain-containing protein [Enterobacteriaceae endosymbiont of Neohaemonia nigricornis]
MNIKKNVLLIILFITTLIPNCIQASINQNINNVSQQHVTHKKHIIEFFSFLCPRCYKFFIITNNKKSISSKYIITKYHVSTTNSELNMLASYNWVIAQALNVEDQVIQPLFEGIQNNTIYDYPTMKKAFINAATNINEQQYDAAWDSFLIKGLFMQQDKLIEHYKISNLPAFVINTNIISMNNILNNCKKNCLANILKLINKSYTYKNINI